MNQETIQNTENTQKAELHIKERDNGPASTDDRWFECWIEGFGRNIFPEGYEPHLFNSSRAIAWCVEMERIGFKHNIEVVRIYENF